MSKKDKLLDRFKSKPKDFTWGEFNTLMKNLGYVAIKRVKSKGARRCFYNEKTNHKISLHEPHPQKILKEYKIKEVLNSLKSIGAIIENS